MKSEKIFILLSLLGILLLMFLTQTVKDQTGTITSIRYSENKITIQLKDQNESLIIFDPQPLNLEVGDKILFQGNEEIYRGERQIIVKKIVKKD